MRALSLFVLAPGNAQARVYCMRQLRLGTAATPDNPYAPPASATIRRVLQDDASAAMRVAAANALWGSTLPQDGAALLRSATHDASPAVRAAAFRNMYWPARADIGHSRNRASYDAAIDAALQSQNPQIVGAALIARVSLHGADADAATRPFAFDRRPFVRESAIDAYDDMDRFNTGMVCFIESRLSDPDPAVRASVMLRLFRWGDQAAVPSIQRLADSAPTQAERNDARDYVHAFAKQPNIPHGHCSAADSK